MNYRHAFHAGNFADVIKHIVLARIIFHLRGKPAAFRVIDTHAGAGLYDLMGEEASRTGEFHNGIERLIDAALPADVRHLLEPYLDAVAAHNSAGDLTFYPGSPMLARHLLRAQDRLVACELEPRAAATLTQHLRGDRRAKAVTVDGWTALTAYVPPKERRGIVIIDPPYEQPNEFARLASELQAAHRKWETGTYLIWYPIKERDQPDALAKRLRRSGIAKILRVELDLASAQNITALRGSGLIIVNPPWLLETELAVILPALAAALSGDQKDAGWRMDRLASEIMTQ
ncbi:MAG TPA: 23S rRNA (adenine(2030)-N(6))-methyltransferase RlmJ [Xanthobacteraceae bacterium]|jgi:23S rRNA (adenine2030-N6)-methyltransferase